MSRGVPIAKLDGGAQPHRVGMNGKPLENIHGFPVRLVIGGWPASLSRKWLTRIWIRDRVHDGPGNGRHVLSRRRLFLCTRTIWSILTNISAIWNQCRSAPSSHRLADGTRFPAGTRELSLRGASWAGDYDVADVCVSINHGATWQHAALPRYATGMTGSDGPRGDVAVGRLLRNLLTRDRQPRIGAAIRSQPLEPGRIWRKPDPADRASGRLSLNALVTRLARDAPAQARGVSAAARLRPDASVSRTADARAVRRSCASALLAQTDARYRDRCRPT